MGVPFLVGERLYLRSLEESDVDGEYASWLNDEEVCQGNSHHRHPYTRDAARAYVERSRRWESELALAIVLKDGNRHIGNIALTAVEAVYRTADFTILLGAKDCWGKGYASEAGRLLLGHAFLTLNLTRVACATFETNVGMQKLAEELGMELEGRRRQAAFKDGRHLDILEYGVLRDEYLERVDVG